MAEKIYNIEKISIEDAEKLKIDTKLWGYDEYTADVSAKIVYDDEGFIIEFKVEESNPLIENKEHFKPVNQDSCVEWFVNFTPDDMDRYINFEVNAGGYMNASFRADRYDSVHLLKEEIEGLNIKANVFDTYWTVSFKVGFDFIKKYYPTFDIEKCHYVKGNLQKCGDNTEVYHLMSYFPIKCEKPDFHRPEYFEKLYVKH